MEIQGVVQNGVVVFEGKAAVPDGTRVVVSWLPTKDQKPKGERVRVQLPLVTSGVPGSIALTNDRIQEILDEEDMVSLKGLGNVSS